METYITISTLNDFIFCPRSIYYHALYSKYSDKSYKDLPQINGTLKHESIDNCAYSTSKHILQGMSVFSEKYNIGGKVDVFDMKTGDLIERKAKIKKIYDGYLYQVWAQYFCLIDMGYKVKRIFLHSLSDNKRYPIKLPNKDNILSFERLLKDIRSFKLSDDFVSNSEKCSQCIYSELCDFKT